MKPVSNASRLSTILLLGLAYLTNHKATAQVIKINVYTAKSPVLGINGGLTVKASGTLTTLSGLTYRETYQISEHIKEENALALKTVGLGVIGSSTMRVDEYEVTADYTLLNIQACAKFFDDLDDGDYYTFGSSTRSTTALIGLHQKKWYVLLPQGYRVNQQIMGDGTVYANNTAFQGNTFASLIGNQTGSCGISWTTGAIANQSVLIDFQEPPPTQPPTVPVQIAAGSLENDPSKAPPKQSTVTIQSGAFFPAAIGAAAVSLIMMFVV